MDEARVRTSRQRPTIGEGTSKARVPVHAENKALFGGAVNRAARGGVVIGMAGPELDTLKARFHRLERV